LATKINKIGEKMPKKEDKMEVNHLIGYTRETPGSKTTVFTDIDEQIYRDVKDAVKTGWKKLTDKKKK
jgi:hypothetical protein